MEEKQSLKSLMEEKQSLESLMEVSSGNPKEANSSNRDSLPGIRPWNTFCAFNVVTALVGGGARSSGVNSLLCPHHQQNGDLLSLCLCSGLGMLEGTALKGWLGSVLTLEDQFPGECGLWPDWALCSYTSLSSICGATRDAGRAVDEQVPVGTIPLQMLW